MGFFDKQVVRNEDSVLRPVEYSAHRSLTASAERVNISDNTEIQALRERRKADKWQDQALEYLDLVGELKFSANLIASVLSRIVLFPGYITAESLVPSYLENIKDIPDELKKDARSAIRLLGTGNGGVSGLLRDASLNIFVAGECYLIQQPAEGTKRERWHIRSVKELEVEVGKKGGMFLKGRRDMSSGARVKLPETAYVGRIWNSHPAYSDEADSSVRGLLELLDELLLLNRASRAIARSKLNAGIVGIPDSLDNTYQADGEYPDPLNPEESTKDFKEEETESFIEVLQDTLSRPIQDESAPSSLVPTMFRGTKDDIDAIRHITFERPFDEIMMMRADKVLDRILAGLDIPKEIVAGIADSKYANAVVIEETLYKSHIEPLALLLVDSLTEVFLHPVLRAKGWTDEELEHVVLWYDPAAITTKPSKAEAATEGYNMHLISGDAWRRAHGFSGTDAATELEIGQRMAVERGLLSEPVTEALLATLLPELMSRVRQGEIAQSPDGAELQDVLDGDSIPGEEQMGPEGSGTDIPEEGSEGGGPSPTGLIEP